MRRRTPANGRTCWQRIVDDLTAHPGSTWGEVTDRTGIGSPHRRTPDARKYGWTFRTTFERGFWVHYAYAPERGDRETGRLDARPIVVTAESHRGTPDPPHPDTATIILSESEGDSDDAIGRREEEAIQSEQLAEALSKLGRTSVAGISASPEHVDG